MMHRRFVSLATILVVVLGLISAPQGESAEVSDLAEQKDRQRQIQQETEKLLRRIETMIRVLEYNRLGASGQKSMLDEVSKTLSGVSREQMVVLIAALEKAGAAKGDARSKELRNANAQHERIVVELKGLLAKFDAVRSLDQAAERFEKLARDQAEQTFVALQILPDAERSLRIERRRNPIIGRIDRTASETTFIRKDFVELVSQVAELRGQLPADQKARAVTLAEAVKSNKMAESFDESVRLIRIGSYSSGAELNRVLNKAIARQWELSDDLLGLARVVRSAPDRLTVLREAKQRLEKSIEEQLAVRKDTVTPPKLEGGDVNKEEANKPDPTRREEPELNRRDARFRFRMGNRKGEEVAEPVDPAAVQGSQTGDRQGWLEYDTRTTRALLAVHLPELGEKLEPVEQLMRDSQAGLRWQHQPGDVTPAQDEALEGLREVKREVDALLLREEESRNDPLANLKEALERVEQLMTEQKELRDRTEQLTAKRQTTRLPAEAPKQAKLSEKTQTVKQDALAANPQVKQALDRASKQMDTAAATLREQKGKETTPKQDEALKNLDEAKKALQEQIKEAEQRREEIAKLEEAREKLAELIKEEQKIADKANAMSEKSAAKEGMNDSTKLAKKQAEVTPPTKQLGDSLKDTAPEAAKNVKEGAKAMESAKTKLEKTQPKEGAKMAKDAVAKLNEADKSLQKALEQKKAEEANAQAAMQPNKVDPQAATQQIAKALEQAQMAQKAAEMAAKAEKAMENLAKAQQKIGEQSPKANAAEAKRPAMDAAEAIKKGDLNKAMQEQKNALAKLEKAAMQGEKAGQKGEKSGEKGEKGESPKASQLAQAQKELMDATAQLAKSQAATQAAMSALGQAQAKAPKAVQKQLGKAGQQLAKANQSLQKGEPKSAGKAQGEAAQELAKALATLNQAVASATPPQQGMGEGQGMGMGMGEGEGEGMGQAQGMGKGMGKGQAKGQQPGQSQEREGTKGEGNRLADGAGRDEKGVLGDTRGKGLFINLPPRQRELLRQAMTEKLPPEYAAMIQQYFINIAKGKPATAKK